MKVMLVVPAYNVARVLPQAAKEIPSDFSGEVLVIDDGSTDGTGAVAKSLGFEVITHPVNRGYGGAQKTGYLEAIKRGADITVLVHGDNQYDPSMIKDFISKIHNEGYDVVTGTRMMLGDARKNGMPIWKYIPNRFLTWLENKCFNTNISDYHNGFRAYKVSFLKQVPLELLSEKFDFDTDIIIQAAIRNARIAEIPHPTRYNAENSQMPFSKGVIYGLSILGTIYRYWLHQIGFKQRLFSQTPLTPSKETNPSS